MAMIRRVLDPEPVRNLEGYRAAGGGKGLEAARKLGPAATIEEIEASGLRGRGGAGFPTGRKWATVATNESSPGGQTAAAPTLVNNAETIANVPGILAEGATWFRQVGTAESPGTVVCTVSGGGRRAGVAEFEMGTPLREVIDTIGGPGRPVRAVLSGVANPFLPGGKIDTPVTYGAMEAAGTGLGAAGFLVFTDADDLAAVAAGVARFLAVESCGQCTPCKQDGLAIAEVLARACCGQPQPGDADELASRVATVADEARCALATQQQRVIGSLLSLFPDAWELHQPPPRHSDDYVLIAALVDIKDGKAILDEEHRTKQPDWTFGETYSGKSPADRLDQRLEEATTG